MKKVKNYAASKKNIISRKELLELRPTKNLIQSLDKGL